MTVYHSEHKLSMHLWDTPLAEASGTAAAGVGRQLGIILDRLRERYPEGPWLPAIVINKNERTPSAGLFSTRGFKLDFDDQGHRAWWRAMVAAVFANDWSRVEID